MQIDKNNISDKYVIDCVNLLKQSNKRIYKYSFDENVINYIINRYSDSLSFSESLYRILNNINVRPVCCRCGNFVKFNNLTKGFYKHCSNSCAQGDPNVFKKAVKKKKEKYGSANNYNKIKQTNKQKYGYEFTLQRPEIKKQIKQTCFEKYGDENYRNINKAKQTCFEKYGVEYWFNSNDCLEKTIKKFGVDNYRKTEESKNKTSTYIKTHKTEIQEKKKLTCLKKYGVDNPMKLESIKNKINKIEQKNKEYITKRKNKTFNTSKQELQTYELLKKIFPDVLTQYKSDAYPFACDFYIPSLNLYIECNYHWTHGDHAYDSNNIDDYNKLKLWESKTSKFYRNAIITWTCRDVNKRNIAKQNNLNYKEFFSILELNKWLNEYGI